MLNSLLNQWGLSVFVQDRSAFTSFPESLSAFNNIQLYKHFLFFSEDLGWLDLAVAKNGVKQLKGGGGRERVAPVPHCLRCDTNWWWMNCCSYMPYTIGVRTDGLRSALLRHLQGVRIHLDGNQLPNKYCPQKTNKMQSCNTTLVLHLIRQEAKTIRYDKVQHFKESCSRRRY